MILAENLQCLCDPLQSVLVVGLRNICEFLVPTYIHTVGNLPITGAVWTISRLDRLFLYQNGGKKAHGPPDSKWLPWPMNTIILKNIDMLLIFSTSGYFICITYIDIMQQYAYRLPPTNSLPFEWTNKEPHAADGIPIMCQLPITTRIITT